MLSPFYVYGREIIALRVPRHPLIENKIEKLTESRCSVLTFFRVNNKDFLDGGEEDHVIFSAPACEAYYQSICAAFSNSRPSPLVNIHLYN